LTDRQKFKITSVYYHDTGDRESSRVNTKASWEVLVDDEMDLSFRISAFDRYDSMPGPSDPENELDVAALGISTCSLAKFAAESALSLIAAGLKNLLRPCQILMVSNW
jgi:hypothetical protein